VVVKAQKLVAKHSRLRPPEPAFQFARGSNVPSALALGKPAGRLYPSFSSMNTPSWKFDAATGLYRRFQADGEKDRDERRQQLTAVNVVVQMVGISSEYGVPRSLVVGRGTAWISTGGQTVKARWVKKRRADMTVFTLKGGEVVTLAPGRTWVELVPETTGSFEQKRR
jgi:hypothetical protein